MTYLIVKDASGKVVAWGPNGGGYAPQIPPGGSSEISDVAPGPSLDDRKSSRADQLGYRVAAIEAKQTAPMRNILLALVAGKAPPPAAVTKLQAFDSQIAALQNKIDAINAAATQSALDALPD